MTRPKLFAELCAGTAALSLALQGGARCRPPVSRPGAKTGYSEAILGAAGLYRGQGADSYLWCEPEPGPRSVLACYPDPVKLREVEAVIRGWIGEDPRALWTRLRGEMKGRELTCPEWLWYTAVSHSAGGCGGFSGEFRALNPAAQAHMGPTTCAKYARENGRDERGYPLAPQGQSRGEIADRLSALASLHWPPVAIAEDARGVRVEDVAGWLALGLYAYRCGVPESGFAPCKAIPQERTATSHGSGALTLDGVADRVRDVAIPWPPVAIAPDARQVLPGGADLEGCVAYLDPPYENTTPYAHKLPRAEVLTLARAWSDAGALVMISEAVPVEGLGSGWESLEITGHRRGQARTWAREKHEFLTMNRPPVHRMAEQPGLFAAAK